MNPKSLSDRVQQLEGQMAKLETEMRLVRYAGGVVATILSSVIILLITGAIAH